MKLETQPATLADIYELSLHLSEISKAELSQVFGANWWQGLARVKEFLNAGPAEVLRADGKPVCALGHMPHAGISGARVTWFIAAQSYFDMGARGTIYGRNYMRRLQREFPGTVFYSYTYSPHPDVDRWFRLCGMTYLGKSNGVRAYVLPVMAQNAKKTGSTRA